MLPLTHLLRCRSMAVVVVWCLEFGRVFAVASVGSCTNLWLSPLRLLV